MTFWTVSPVQLEAKTRRSDGADPALGMRTLCDITKRQTSRPMYFLSGFSHICTDHSGYFVTSDLQKVTDTKRSECLPSCSEQSVLVAVATTPSRDVNRPGVPLVLLHCEAAVSPQALCALSQAHGQISKVE